MDQPRPRSHIRRHWMDSDACRSRYIPSRLQHSSLDTQPLPPQGLVREGRRLAVQTATQCPACPWPVSWVSRSTTMCTSTFNCTNLVPRRDLAFQRSTSRRYPLNHWPHSMAHSSAVSDPSPQVNRVGERCIVYVIATALTDGALLRVESNYGECWVSEP